MSDQQSKRTAPPALTVATPKESGLSTFGGVFTPSILTILGVIMYLRFGWVVGNVGLIGTLLIVTLSTGITFMTALSIAAIATDQKVRVGGAYYMISRSLGIESGGAIGIPLYLAQGLSVALYTVGFAESIVDVFPALNMKVVGVVTTIGVTALALVSAKVAIRAQYFIMGGIALSLLSLVFGQPIEETTIEMWGAADRHSEPFWTVFAVFFPAVTGIMAGVNMSGDLKDPGKSIPRGTFWAVGVGFVIYMALPIIIANRADALTLIEDPLIMRRMALWGDAILIGVWGATLSSAVGSILGAPRVLQALARDGVLPRRLEWLGKGSGEDDAPRAGTVVTLGLALAAVYLGNLNVIAPILTMFFLTTYGMLNVTAGIERLLNSPSFRPSFQVHWSFSLLGAVGCAAVMFLINAAATVVAGIFVAGIFLWLQRREMRSAWGDVWQGVWMAVTRAGLLRLRGAQQPKTWRPHLLVLSGAPTRRWHLIDFASSLSHNRGLITVSTVLTSEAVTHERQGAMEERITRYLGDRGIRGLVRVITAPDAFEGAERLIDAYGLGGLTPNSVLLGDSESIERRDRYCQMISYFYHAGRNVFILRDAEDRGFGSRRRIDVWWGGLKGNGALMLLLSYLVKTDLSWRGATVRLKIVVPNESAAVDVRANIGALLAETRIGAELHVILDEGRPFDDILQYSSRDADLVFLGMAGPDSDYVSYYERLRKRTDGLPPTVFVLAGEGIAFDEVLL